MLVAHSISGVLAPRLMETFGDRVADFAAVGAAIPRRDGSFLSTLPLPRRLVMAAVLRILGTRPPDSAIEKSMCNDLDHETATDVVERFVPESRALYTAPGGVGFPDLPGLYVHLGADREFGKSLQRRMAANVPAVRTEEIGSGHLPMLSHPVELAGVLNRLMATAVLPGH